jgi:hypothetical protein
MGFMILNRSSAQPVGPQTASQPPDSENAIFSKLPALILKVLGGLHFSFKKRDFWLHFARDRMGELLDRPSDAL